MGFDRYSLKQFVFSSVIIAAFLLLTAFLMLKFISLPQSHNDRLSVSWTFTEQGQTPDIASLWKQPVDFTTVRKKHNYNFGFTRKDVWMKLSIQSSPTDTFLFIDINNIIDEIEVRFTPYSSPYYFGRNYPVVMGRPGSLIMNHSVIPIRMRKDNTTVLIRFSNALDPLQIPIKVYTYAEKEFNNNKMLLLAGVLLGFLILTLLINGLFHFILTDKTYIVYTVFLFFFLIYLLSNYGLLDSLFRIPLKWWNLRDHTFYVILKAFFSVVFINNFLGIREKNPVVFKVAIYGTAGLSALFIALLSMGAALNAVVFIVYIIFLLIFPLASLVYILFYIDRRNVAHVFFFMSCLSISFGIIVHTMMKMGIFPWSMVTNSLLWIFFVIHVFLMFMALADRVRGAQIQRERAERKLSDERNRIAAEIHDSVGADFAVFVQELMVWPDKRYPARQIIPKLKFYLIRIRDIVYMLNRDYDIHKRLEKELKERIQRMSRLKRFSITSNFEMCGEIMGLEKSYHLLCVFDEWMTNILKYSKSTTTIHVRLFKENNRVRLLIEHDGEGIEWKPGHNPDKIKEGQGLQSITWRARSIGAEAVSHKGEMNNFTLSIPVQFVTGIL